MIVGGSEITFQIDTGSSVNMLPARFAEKIEPTKKILRMWNKTQLNPLGKSHQLIENPKNGKMYEAEFVVFEGDQFTPLLGLKTSQEMELLEVCPENFHQVAQLNVAKVEDKYCDVFDGTLGQFPGVQHLEVDPEAQPVVMANRRIPHAVRPLLKQELEKLEKNGVVAPVNEPTPWVSQIVVAKKKNGGLRICLDPPALNKALKREHYTLPVLDDVLHELSQSTVFTKVDLSSGYWHVTLDEESSRLTTFQTCFGRYRWRRLPFGTNVSSEIFQKKLLEAFDGLKGVVCLADDIIIHGKGTNDHDINLDEFFMRCREKNVKLNKEKLELRTNKITFMGHVITSEGLRTDPEKVKAVTEYPRPQNLEELRRFLGMINYLARYLTHLTEVIYPLQNLLKKDVSWTWSESQEHAFQTVKQMIVKSPVLAFYDPEKELTLENDASEYGLGSVLTQDGKPVAFASRSLSCSEKNYAQIEKEMLAVVYGLEKFHHYTYGRQVNVITDHKPLISITSKALSCAPKRLQAMLLRAQSYNYSLTYKPGSQIPVADALSRAPVSQAADVEFESVNSFDMTSFKPHRIDEIKRETAADSTLTELMDTVVKGWPNQRCQVPHTILPYFDYRDELSVQDGVLFRGERVLIPASMRKDMKEKLHAGHAGINSTVRRARSLIFWSRMSSDIRQYIESCDICSSHCVKQSPEPLHMHEVPDHPWQKVGTDIFSLKGKHYLITVDYFSQFIEVDFLPDTTSETVVHKLKYHFARYGVPDILISDNGPQFSSEHFRKFSRKWGFSHETSSPGHSQANGAAEAAVKVVKKMMQKCYEGHEDHYLGLLNLRNTPQEGLSTSPAQRLMGRRTRTLIPTTPSLLRPMASDQMDKEKEKMEKKRATVAEQYMTERKNLDSLQAGENVRIQPIDNSSHHWRQATVIQRLKNRSYEVMTETGKRLRRNRVFLRSKPRSTHHRIGSTDGQFDAPFPGLTTAEASGRPTDEDAPSPADIPQTPPHETIDLSGGGPKTTPTNENKNNDVGTYTTKSGRAIKPRNVLNL